MRFSRLSFAEFAADQETAKTGVPHRAAFRPALCCWVVEKVK